VDEVKLKKKPNLFLVGCGKSGTSSLHRYLGQHPEIFMSEVKGPNYFGIRPDETYSEYFGNLQKYLSLFSHSVNEKILGEASHYFHLKRAPKKIKRFNSFSKVIILLRDPYEVVKSYYNAGAIPKDIDFFDKSSWKIIPAWELYESLKYSENVERWFNTFGMENVKIVFTEDLKNNAKETYISISNWLGIDALFVPEFKIYNSSRTIKNKWVLSLLNWIPSNFKVWFKIKISFKFSEKIRDSIIKLTTESLVKDKLNSDLAFKMGPILNLEIKKLESLLDKNLSNWIR
jgi:hypothetical protein